MKVTIQRPIEVEVINVRLKLPVRYQEEDMPNDFPLRKGDLWEAVISVDNGSIQGWPEGQSGSFYMKVCDEGTYTLLDERGAEIAAIKNDYVPNDLIPGEYGDYVHLEISEDGFVTNWPKSPQLDAFFDSDEA